MPACVSCLIVGNAQQWCPSIQWTKIRQQDNWTSVRPPAEVGMHKEGSTQKYWPGGDLLFFLCFQSTVGCRQNGTPLLPLILLRVHGMEVSNLRNNLIEAVSIIIKTRGQRHTERGGWSRERFPFPLNNKPTDNAPFHPHAYFSGQGLSLITTGIRQG